MIHISITKVMLVVLRPQGLEVSDRGISAEFLCYKINGYGGKQLPKDLEMAPSDLVCDSTRPFEIDDHVSFDLIGERPVARRMKLVKKGIGTEAAETRVNIDHENPFRSG